MTSSNVIPPSEDIVRKGFDAQLTQRLASYLKPYLGQLVLSLLLMLLNSAAAVAGPYLIQIAIDQGMLAHNLRILGGVTILYLLAMIIQWLSIYFRVNIMTRVGQGMIFDLRQQLFSHLQELSLSFFSHYSVGRLITRVINDVEVLRDFLTWALLAIARDLFTVFGILVAMLVMDIKLSLIAFSVLPLMVLLTVVFRRIARDNYRKVRAAISWVNSVLSENINGVRVVQAFSRQEVNFNYFKNTVNKNNRNTQIHAAKIAASYPAGIDFLGLVTVSLIVLIGGLSILRGDGSITAGILVAFVLYIDRFFEPIRDLSSRYDSFQSVMASSERIFLLADTLPEVSDIPGASTIPPINGDVTFEKVSFHYSDDPTPVLENIDLAFHAGETVAFVGKTGAGKSTMVKLISRFHDPSQGRILVDGIDIKMVTQKSLRSQMGIVLQDPFLFSGSVSENIRFGRLEATQEEIELAARAVGAHDFISHLPDGYETSVEEGGVVLSVGQRQLISFARALLADPRILILDEATSSVDTQTERLIQEALSRLLRNRTSFVIAHRLSTVVNADRIVLVQNGQITEEGTHSQLLALQGEYYRLYRSGFEE